MGYTLIISANDTPTQAYTTHEHMMPYSSVTEPPADMAMARLVAMATQLLQMLKLRATMAIGDNLVRAAAWLTSSQEPSLTLMIRSRSASWIVPFSFVREWSSVVRLLGQYIDGSWHLMFTLTLLQSVCHL